MEEILRSYDQGDISQNYKDTDELLAAMQKEFKSLFPRNDQLPDIGEDDHDENEYSYYDEEDDQEQICQED